MTQVQQNAVAAPVVAAIPVRPLPAEPSIPPGGRLARELEGRWRVVAAVVAGAGLVYGGVLAWREETSGTAVAALFGVAVISLIFALAGVVPASVKLGDLEVTLEQAKAEAKAEGRQEGSLDGLRAGAKISNQLDESKREQFQDLLTRALSTEAPLSVPSLDLTLQVPKLNPADAERNAALITSGLMS